MRRICDLNPKLHRRIAALALLLAGTGAVLALGGASASLAVLPLLLLWAPLIAGRYVGEDHLQRWRAGRERPRSRRPRPLLVVPTVASRASGLQARWLRGPLARRPPPLAC